MSDERKGLALAAKLLRETSVFITEWVNEEGKQKKIIHHMSLESREAMAKAILALNMPDEMTGNAVLLEENLAQVARRARESALDELTAEAQKLGMYN